MRTQRVAHAHNILRRVLAVRVGGYDARERFVAVQRFVQAGFQRAALAEIDRVVHDRTAERLGLVEQRPVLRAAAVVDEQHVQPFSAQSAAKRQHFRIRLISRNQHNDRTRHTE